LKTCRIDEAMGIFYQSVNKEDGSFKEKEDSLYLDAAWNLVE
jgi:DNA-dependent RNA polymerase auxiliary subunit epsilon